MPYLQSKSWDTRTAAAKAIGGIVANTAPFDPNADEAEVKADEEFPDQLKSEPNGDGATTSQRLSLAGLDLSLILQHGQKLLGSAGKDHESVLASMSPIERLAWQKKSLTARLGLRGEFPEDELFTEFGLSLKNARTPILSKVDTKLGPVRDMSIQESPQSTTTSTGDGANPDHAGLSARQINQLKRKNKFGTKPGTNKMRVVDLSGRRPSDAGEASPVSTPHPVKVNGKEDSTDEMKTNSYFSIKREATEDDDTQLVKEFKGETEDEKPIIQPDEEHSTEWPFEVMCDFLANDLFDANWEIRHGAAMGLRELLRSHGKGAARRFGLSRSRNEASNNGYLEDIACRLVCVLMLDRFGDYVSDTVVAPLREAAGQSLGALLSQVSDTLAVSIYDFLQIMIIQKDTGLKRPIWEVSHGGMIGLRYFVAVRKDLLLEDNDIIDGVLAAVTRGLAHSDDDVKSVSAATLVPIAAEVTKLRPLALGSLMTVVWDCLLDMQDDLSASTGTVMDLLATLCSYPEVIVAMRESAEEDPEQSFDQLVPRLYHFLRHTITSVRQSVLKALSTFLSIAPSNTSGWVDGRFARLLFQNMLLERNQTVVRASFEVWQSLMSVIQQHEIPNFWTSLSPHVQPMLQSALSPVGQARRPIPLDTTLLIKPSGAPMSAVSSKHSRKDSDQHSKKRQKIEEEAITSQRETHNTDGHMIHGEVELVGSEVILRTRIYCARALGLLLPAQDEHGFGSYWTTLSPYLQSRNSSTRLYAGMVAEELAKHSKLEGKNLTDAVSQLQILLDAEAEPWYADIVSSLQAARGQCHTLLNAFQHNAQVSRGKLPTIAVVCQGEDGAGPNAFSLSDAEAIVSHDFDRLIKSLTPVQRVAGTQYLHDARNNAKEVVEEAKSIKLNRDTAVRASIGSVLVALYEIPKKPGQLIKSLMDSIKAEEHEELQMRSANAVAALIDHYSSSPKRGPVDKLVSNLAKFSCVDTSETPEFERHKDLEDVVLSLRKEEDRRDHPDAARFEREAKEARIMRRGARLALGRLASLYGPALLEKLPVLKALLEEPLQPLAATSSPKDFSPTLGQGQELVDTLSTLKTISPMLDSGLHSWVLTMMPLVAKAMRSRLSVVRYVAAKCFATICSVMPAEAMTTLVEQVLPNISNPLDLSDRQGITECVYHLIQIMGDDILPYVIFLIVQVLGRMSDANDDVRLLATTSFATLVKLVPLESGILDPPGMPKALLEGRERERKFMAQMLDPKKVEPFEIPVAIKAELRPYQQDGVNWLAFLNRFGLHGVLCDDMGLGKTLQTLCIVASDHHLRAEEYAQTKAPDKRPMPSLIVCPPSLSGHWQQEIKQFAPFLTCVPYVGGPSERSGRRHHLQAADIVITTYDICRNDTETLVPITWNYCVLDEGHLIKNPKIKLTQAVKKLVSNHRLILSGTPIQNNVLELWSLFDFLMPGFLATERVFQDRFAKPIQQSRNAKSNSREQEAGALAIEALHKQVLPFLLRRMKEEVLNDLPPKILQNYYCDLSDLQRQLFEEFFKKEKKSVEAEVGSGEKESKQHIFQALQYMRKLCNSPALVVKEGNKQYEAVTRQLAAQKSRIRDVAHAPKLSALRDLLVDCGIGVTPSDLNDVSATNYVSPHRALIFCQMKEMLDMVQDEVFGKLLPSAQFLRLDGNVEATKRQSIVNKFNNDPSYDALLLTTTVGGLGLNLTGADTVIFVEHDWNPQKDIQAMDRAHRIGQKKVVNVYRLITRGTLEEKILSLQRFKIDVASTVVNQQNAGLGTMETDQILDLFNLDMPEVQTEDKSKEEDLVDVETGEVKKKGEKQGWLNDIGDLWEERQYEEEFNLDSFVQNLQK